MAPNETHRYQDRPAGESRGFSSQLLLSPAELWAVTTPAAATWQPCTAEPANGGVPPQGSHLGIPGVVSEPLKGRLCKKRSFMSKVALG
mmetsp:Transcript_795/g.2398  ORF Transcript_795/g.2398 Transcript_795/m.2398 type:complete len:89 (-) Transcript_795:1606-1872(-)